jgi:hypothetical protein
MRPELPPPDPHETLSPPDPAPLVAPTVVFAAGATSAENDRVANLLLDVRPGLLLVFG